MNLTCYEFEEIEEKDRRTEDVIVVVGCGLRALSTVTAIQILEAAMVMTITKQMMVGQAD